VNSYDYEAPQLLFLKVKDIIRSYILLKEYT
jgi:hypothetical protein